MTFGKSCELIMIAKVVAVVSSAKVFLGFPVSKSECWDGS